MAHCRPMAEMAEMAEMADTVTGVTRILVARAVAVLVVAEAE